MNSSLRHRQLNNLYSKLKKLGFIDKNSEININQILKDLAYINKLIYDTYLIFNSEKTKSQKITLLHKLKDPKGIRLFTKKIAKKIYERYSQALKNVINSIKQKRIQSINNNQTGGSLDIKNNKIDKILNYVNDDPEYKSQVLKVLKGYVNSPILIDIKNSELLFSFFNTNKKYRKDIKTILINLEYDFLNNQIKFNNLKVDNVDVNTQLSTIIDDINGNDLNNFIKSRRLINELFKAYAG